MPIKIADSLPARAILESENIFVMTEHRALRQDIRPLRIALLNLMPTKIITETQICRCLSNTPIQIEIDLIQMSSYQSKNVSADHMLSFYKTFDEVKDSRYDGLIITGAPVEKMDFEDVDYWPELRRIMDWSLSNVHSTFHVCWGAQAALHYHYGIPKYLLEEKISGVFQHKLIQNKEHLFRGFDDTFWAPHSRHTEVRTEDILAHPDINLLAVSDEAGVYIAEAMYGRQIFVMGHGEYDANTLKDEYLRDMERGLNPNIPKHYFADDDPQQKPIVSWRSHGQLLYTNWLNHYVYQTTPYDIFSSHFTSQI